MRPEFFWMGGMWIFPLIMFGVMFVVVALVLSTVFGKGRKLPCSRFHEGKTPLEILKERYARGEISREEFEQMKKDILDQ